MKFWKITHCDSDLFDLISEGFENVFNDTEHDFDLRFIHEGGIDFLLPERPERLLYLIGERPDAFYGYAMCDCVQGDFGFIAEHSNLEIGSSGEFVDSAGRRVSLEEISGFRGYEDYTGYGTVLSIHLFNIFIPGRRYGSQLLRFIQDDDHELIEAKAVNSGVALFYEQNDFIRTGIYGNLGEAPVVVWNNPEYQ